MLPSLRPSFSSAVEVELALVERGPGRVDLETRRIGLHARHDPLHLLQQGVGGLVHRERRGSASLSLGGWVGGWTTELQWVTILLRSTWNENSPLLSN